MLKPGAGHDARPEDAGPGRHAEDTLGVRKEGREGSTPLWFQWAQDIGQSSGPCGPHPESRDGVG